MKKLLLTVLPALSLLAQNSLAQTAPPPATEPTKDNVWMIYDHPVPRRR
ncbi:hypothetical protein [Hymenobacter cellulosilyticus]|uniref:Uncharacterized protein n=1 Tax=Hymenobacter cellulosilyticus TaxID=2932248 RepID=A0A8T9Q8J7_9BACT|nr:hypothetical protein [Hymenobacter cellulosilyticus]UOQ73877.1 hypothetical protein MUN79_08195 [Hymenobacter cellulosilyticus]